MRHVDNKLNAYLIEAVKEDDVAKTKKLIEEKSLDLAFVYIDEYNVMNGRYLAGWCPTVERGAVIVSSWRTLPMMN